MIKKITKKEIVASSSGWLSLFLNLLPGLGTGYIYQRRWLPYTLTIGAIIAWIGLGIIFQNNNTPSEKEQLIGLIGLSLISIITSIESYFAQKKACQFLAERKIEDNKVMTKKGWFSK